MKTVWKFSFEIKDTIKIKLPAFAEILHVETQGNFPAMWCLVDDEAEYVEKTFYLRGTGHEVEKNLVHISTWIDGPFVWHLFENKG